MSQHQPLTDVPLTSLDLEPSLLKGVAQAGFQFCTPIQAQALPLVLAGRDVEGQAQTGTGKTAAFLLGAMNWLLRHEPPGARERNQPRVVILAPTRELAVQIYEDARVLGQFTTFRIGVVYGGTGYDSQREMLRDGIDILIGTPGRMIDYFKQRIFNLKAIQVAIIDEADRMFDLGFIRDIRYLLRRMPPPEKRLNLLFSATLSFRVTELAYEHMNNPTVVNASPERVTVAEVAQVLYHVSKDEKISLLVGLLRRIDPTRTMVFTNTKRVAERVCAYLRANGFDADMLSGDVPQKKRLRLLERFRDGQLPILVATDVAARGLHISDVSHVVNFDLPQDAEDYVHRIGRTARAGASGDAVSFACEEYVFSLSEIEEFIGQSIETRRATDDLLAKLERPKFSEFRRQPGARRPPRGRHKPGGKGGGQNRSKRRSAGAPSPQDS